MRASKRAKLLEAMTEARPPKEGASNSEPESQEDAQSGRRSQTRSVGGHSPSGNAAAPRATFSPATSGAPKASPGSKQTPAPRSVFQQAASGPMPTSSDPDKTVKRPYPTAPSTWGQTLPIGDLLPGQNSALFPSEEAEKTVQVTRSAFVKTLISTEGLTPPTPPESVPPRPRSARPAPEPAGHAPAPDDEPLTLPSTRPAPAPWQQSRAAAPTGTMLMPGSPGANESARPVASAERNASAASQSRGAAPAVQASARVGHASAKQTLPLGSAAITAEAAGVGAPAPESAPATSSATRQAAGGPRANASATAAKPPAARPPSGSASARPASMDGKNVSEPLQLRISAQDVVPQANFSERPVLPRSRGPLVAALLIAALLVLGAIAWFGLAKPAAPVAEPTRNDAVTVPVAQQPAVPAQAPAETGQPVQTATAKPAATGQPAAQPSQAPASPQVQQPTAAPARAVAAPAAPKPQPAPSAASRRRAERRAAARRQAAQPEATAPAAPAAAEGEVPEDVQEARDALRALDSEPVIKIKPAPSPDDLEVPDFPSLPEPPEPPPPPPDGE
jgi:hypothetical protein